MSNILYISLYAISVFVSACSQVLLKKSANEYHKNILFEYLNSKVIIGYSIFLICTMLTMLAYRGIDLSLGPVIESTSYIYIVVFGTLFFNETINLKKIIALLMIVSGVVMFSLF